MNTEKDSSLINKLAFEKQFQENITQNKKILKGHKQILSESKQSNKTSYNQKIKLHLEQFVSPANKNRKTITFNNINKKVAIDNKKKLEQLELKEKGNKTNSK